MNQSEGRMLRTFVVSVWTLLLVFVIAFSQLSPAQTPVKNRIAQAVDNSQRTALRGNVSPRARTEFDRGLVDRGMKISGASLVFKPSASQQADLEALLVRQQDPASSDYHKWLTPEQYADRFGMSADDLAKVKAWLQSQNLTVTRTARGRNQIFFSGTAAQIEAAFQTEIHNYVKNGEAYFANATAPSVPAALSGVVLGVRNLDNLRPKPRLRRISPRFTSNLSGNHFLAPDDFATIYNLKPLYDAGLDGSGQSIAVVGQTAVSTTDLDEFRTASNLPARTSSNYQTVLVPGSGTSTTCSGDGTEANLDIEWAGAIARNAKVIYVYVGVDSGKTCSTTTWSVWDSLQYAIDNNLAPVISTSYGYCESGLGSGAANTIQQWAQQANTQGQTISAASGDSGAADCDTGSTATGGLQVDVPAAIPEVTGMGGTEFTGDSAGTVSGSCSAATTYWSGSCSDTNIGSAISYIPETAWNDTANDGVLSSGGGGASAFFPKPSWQTGAGVPSDGQRDVPDISLASSGDHDGYLICSQDYYTSGGSNLTSCTSRYRASDNQTLAVVGGTSAAAPSFAGILAILNQATQSNGLGNVNPTLYSLAGSTTAAFHDITTGNNIVPCSSGTPSSAPAGKRCPTTAPLQIGYSADTGYDLATGLGSIDTNNLVLNWPGYNPGPGFTVAQGSAISVSAPGGSGTSTITATATNGFSGTVNFTCAVSSTTASISCSMSPASVTLDNTTTSANSTLSITTVAPHVVTNTSAQAGSHGFNWLAVGGGTVFAGIFLLGSPTRRRYRGGLLGLILLGVAAFGVGCGGGSGSGSHLTGGTPAGNYTVTVTATSGSLSKQTSVSLVVQ